MFRSEHDDEEDVGCVPMVETCRNCGDGYYLSQPCRELRRFCPRCYSRDSSPEEEEEIFISDYSDAVEFLALEDVDHQYSTGIASADGDGDGFYNLDDNFDNNTYQRVLTWHDADTDFSYQPPFSTDTGTSRGYLAGVLCQTVCIASWIIYTYRVSVIFRIVCVILFMRYRTKNPQPDAYILWLVSLVCEVWLAASWITDQLTRLFPINRETFLDNLDTKYDSSGQPSKLSSIDIFVTTLNTDKEPPHLTCNTVLSSLATEYPPEKLAVYISDDGCSTLLYKALVETIEFAKSWVPFCKKFEIDPPAPEPYFSKKFDHAKEIITPSFGVEHRAIEVEYEAYKLKINEILPDSMVNDEELGRLRWLFRDGIPWPASNSENHPSIVQTFLGKDGDFDKEGNKLPLVVYLSREKRTGIKHHRKAGSMNALVRVSALHSNAAFMLNLDCDHYINNRKALKEAMCFLMEPEIGRSTCFVQFPQRFDPLDRTDRYSNKNTMFYNINLKGLDGIQGPFYVGTGAVFNRAAVYGHGVPDDEKIVIPNKMLVWFKKSLRKINKNGNNGGGFVGEKKVELNEVHDYKRYDYYYDDDVDERTPLKSSWIDAPVNDEVERMMIPAVESDDGEEASSVLVKKYGKSYHFISSTLLEGFGPLETEFDRIEEAVRIIGVNYEKNTTWGKECGWIYGSVTEDILTGLKMHSRGWRSVYAVPERDAFVGTAPLILAHRLSQSYRWAKGSMEILFSRHCPIFYAVVGGRLKPCQRLAYIHATVHPFTSIPLFFYSILPAACLFAEKFTYPMEGNLEECLWFVLLCMSTAASSWTELKWSGVKVVDWWRSEQFWVIGGLSTHLFAVFNHLFYIVLGKDLVTPKASSKPTSNGGAIDASEEIRNFKWSWYLIPPAFIYITTVLGLGYGTIRALCLGVDAWGPLIAKIFMAFWVILHIFPLYKGLLGKRETFPFVIFVWVLLIGSIVSVTTIRSSGMKKPWRGPNFRECGIYCY